MEPRLVDLDSFQVIGFELRTTTEKNRSQSEIPAFWDRVIQDGGIDRIPGRTRQDVLLGICLDGDASGAFSYLIAAEADPPTALPADMVCRTVPAATFAVFTARGPMPQSIPEAFRRIHQEWLPKSGYRQADGPVIEWYDERFHKGDEAELDIYVPVRK